MFRLIILLLFINHVTSSIKYITLGPMKTYNDCGHKITYSNLKMFTYLSSQYGSACLCLIDDPDPGIGFCSRNSPFYDRVKQINEAQYVSNFSPGNYCISIWSLESSVSISVAYDIILEEGTKPPEKDVSKAFYEEMWFISTISAISFGITLSFIYFIWKHIQFKQQNNVSISPEIEAHAVVV